jgi:hypothetical protein
MTTQIKPDTYSYGLPTLEEKKQKNIQPSKTFKKHLCTYTSYAQTLSLSLAIVRKVTAPETRNPKP